MWKSVRNPRVRHALRTYLVGIALAALLGVGLSSCTAAESPSPEESSELDTIAPLPDTGSEEDLDAGTYLVTSLAVPFEITVPKGWQSFGWGVLKQESDQGQVFVNFLNPTAVPTDGCRWRGALVDVEQSSEAYVDAMSAQTSTQTTPPRAVVMDGYVGFEFDYAVEEGVDFADCDEERVCLFADGGARTCTRVHGGVGERETERALDLDGTLAVIAVGQFVPVDPALTAEARAVFDSIRFIAPES